MKTIKWIHTFIKLAWVCLRPSREVGVGDRLPKGVKFLELRSPASQEAHKWIKLNEFLSEGRLMKKKRVYLDDSDS